MASSEIQTCRENLANIESAIASGVKQVSVDGVQTTFNSLSELRRVRNELAAKLARLEGRKPTRKRYKRINLSGI